MGGDTSHQAVYPFTLKASTWRSDSTTLYDFEDRNVPSRTYRCLGRNSEYRIVKTDHGVQLVTETQGAKMCTAGDGTQTLLYIRSFDEGSYGIYPAIGFEPNRGSLDSSEIPEATREELDAWLVVRSFERGSVIIETGDRLKFGRFVVVLQKQHLHNGDRDHDNDEENDAANDDLAMNDQGGNKVGRGTAWNSLPSHSDDIPIANDAPAPAPIDGGGSDGGGAGDGFSYVLRISETDDYAISASGDPPTTESAAPLTTEAVAGAALPQSEQDNKNHNVYPQVMESPLTDNPSGPLCRICLCDENDPDNDPLITPCACKGSLEYVHLVCLRTWMKNRLSFKDGAVESRWFFWSPLGCELCRIPYPTFVSLKKNDPLADDTAARLNREKFLDDPIDNLLYRPNLGSHLNCARLLSCPRPRNPYIVLESFQSTPNKLSTPGYHFLSFAGTQTIRLGRGQDADIRLSDISISRLHAQVRLCSGDDEALLRQMRETASKVGPPSSDTIYNVWGEAKSLEEFKRQSHIILEDTRSKFGTLVHVNPKRGLRVLPRRAISIQVGVTVITMYVQKPSWSRIFKSCLRRPDKANAVPSLRDDIRLLDSYPMS